jgi:hypothetical protein
MATDYLTVEHLSTKDLTRFFSKVTITEELYFRDTPCWIWCGNRTTDCGYGRFRFQGKNVATHRLMFAWMIHPLLTGRQYGEIDHLCRIRACCNPLHLEFVAARTNVLRSAGPAARNAKKTHCIRGHAFSGDNLFYDQGKRQCRICKRMSQARKDPEKLRQYQKTYNDKHKEKRRAYYDAHFEEYRARSRAHYLKRRQQKSANG